MTGFRKFEIIPTLVTLVGVAMMFTLGVWQLQRLEWKQQLVKQVEEIKDKSVLEALPAADVLDSFEYYKVKLSGAFHNKYAFMLPRQYGGKQGYGLVALFELPPDVYTSYRRFILVDRGWIPNELKPRYEEFAKLEVLPSWVTMEGVLRKPQGRGTFTPDNSPEKNLWFSGDMAALEKQFEVKLEPMVIHQTAQEGELPALPTTPGTVLSEEQLKTDMAKKYPVFHDGKVNLRNDHLGYAITWFSVGMAGIIIFLLYHRKKPAA